MLGLNFKAYRLLSGGEQKSFDHRGCHCAEVEIDAPHGYGGRLAANRAYQALRQITDSRNLFN